MYWNEEQVECLECNFFEGSGGWGDSGGEIPLYCILCGLINTKVWEIPNIVFSFFFTSSKYSTREFFVISIKGISGISFGI